jgi:hypothetical protein
MKKRKYTQLEILPLGDIYFSISPSMKNNAENAKEFIPKDTTLIKMLSL